MGVLSAADSDRAKLLAEKQTTERAIDACPGGGGEPTGGGGSGVVHPCDVSV